MTKTIILFAILVMSLQVLATEVKQPVAVTKNSNKSKSQGLNKEPLVIETQVKGSQEQPNVIYIMPWQGIESPVIIEGNNAKITLPNFAPINPKVFKKQAKTFYNLTLKNSNKTVNK